jgi:hypothetical protein
MSQKLTVEGNEVTGEIALLIAPGTKADAIDKQIDQALNAMLHEVADGMGAVLGTYVSRYAKPLPGKDDAGRTRYLVRARREGGRLVPAHGQPKV